MWGSKKKTEAKTNTEHFTVLGKDVTFKGIVHFEGTVQLDSCFEGEIHTKGVLVVGEHAVHPGTVSVGTLSAAAGSTALSPPPTKCSCLKPPCRSATYSPVFSLEEGAYFRGQTNMGPRPSVDGASDFINAPAGSGPMENAENAAFLTATQSPDNWPTTSAGRTHPSLRAALTRAQHAN